MKKFDQGQTVRLTVTFRDFDDALVNPSTVTFFVMREADEDWTETSGGSADSTGIYHLDVDTSEESGVYDWRVIGTGTVSHAKQGKFYIEPMAPPDTNPSP